MLLNYASLRASTWSLCACMPSWVLKPMKVSRIRVIQVKVLTESCRHSIADYSICGFRAEGSDKWRPGCASAEGPNSGF